MAKHSDAQRSDAKHSDAKRRINAGGLVLIVVLLALLAAAAVLGFQGWTAHDDVEMPTSAYVALGLGIVFSLVVGCGLMALVFYSSRKGFDDAVGDIDPDSDRDPGA